MSADQNTIAEREKAQREALERRLGNRPSKPVDWDEATAPYFGESVQQTTGLIANLTPEQRAKALAYRGPETFGPADGPRAHQSTPRQWTDYPFRGRPGINGAVVTLAYFCILAVLVFAIWRLP